MINPRIILRNPDDAIPAGGYIKKQPNTSVGRYMILRRFAIDIFANSPTLS